MHNILAKGIFFFNVQKNLFWAIEFSCLRTSAIPTKLLRCHLIVPEKWAKKYKIQLTYIQSFNLLCCPNNFVKSEVFTSYAQNTSSPKAAYCVILFSPQSLCDCVHGIKGQKIFANNWKKLFFGTIIFTKKLTLIVFYSLAEEDFSLNGGGFRKLWSTKKIKKQIILLKVYWLFIKIWCVLMDSLRFHSDPICCVKIGTGIYFWESG